jgi:hypothetical protein
MRQVAPPADDGSAPGESTGPDAAASALDVVGKFEAGRFDEAAACFSAELRAAAPAQTVAELWHKELDGHEVLTRGPVSLRVRGDGLMPIVDRLACCSLPVKSGMSQEGDE